MKLRTKTEIMRAYDINSPIYDEQRFTTPGGKYLNEMEKQKILGVLKDGSVLEVGAGTCRYGQFLLENGFSYTGVDISKMMLSEAVKKSSEINTVQGDGENLCFKHRSFDNVVCVHALRFINPMMYFNQAYDVLKPGGVVIGQFDSCDNIYTKLSLMIKKLKGIEVKMKFYTHSDVNTIISRPKCQTSYTIDMFNFPNSVYHCLPSQLIGAVKMVDKFQLKNGNIILAVVEKGGQNDIDNRIN